MEIRIDNERNDISWTSKVKNLLEMVLQKSGNIRVQSMLSLV